MIMCAVSNNDYYNLKKRILEIDPSAFMIIDKCYEVMVELKEVIFHFYKICDTLLV